MDDMELFNKIKSITLDKVTIDINKKDNKLMIWIFDTGKIRTINLPKKYDIKWIMKQIEKIQNSKLKNLMNIFEKLEIGGNIYYTSFGFSYDMFFKNESQFKIDINLIKQALDKKELKYKCEFSDAKWVYRFIISQHRDNLKKIH